MWDLAPTPTKPAVELVNGVLPLLKTTKNLVQGVELPLTGATIAVLQILPLLPSSGKLRHLSADLKGDSLADDHLGRKIVSGPLLQLLLKGLENSRRDRGRVVSSPEGGTRGIREVGSNEHGRGAINMAKNPEVVKDPPDGQLSKDIVGVVEHHIGMLEVPMPNLRENLTEPIDVHKWRRKERR